MFSKPLSKSVSAVFEYSTQPYLHKLKTKVVETPFFGTLLLLGLGLKEAKEGICSRSHCQWLGGDFLLVQMPFSRRHSKKPISIFLSKILPSDTGKLWYINGSSKTKETFVRFLKRAVHTQLYREIGCA